ncbi:hypothetical protein U1Q18_014339 [Sarracenia purpurea var. burkii]
MFVTQKVMMMANPRRNSFSAVLNNQSSEINSNNLGNPFQSQSQTTLSSVKFFLKKPHAFPFLLSIFLLLTWISLRIQHSAHFSSPPHLTHQRQWRTAGEDDDNDGKVNLVRFASGYPSRISKDKRGWLLNPISVAVDAGISGGALNCASIHLGEIRPGGVRGNHRHYTCNETILIWGAKTIFRLENNSVHKGYAEVTIGADEVAVAASPHGTAHALVNVDSLRSTFFMGCQDSIIDYNNSTSDFNVWKDL